MNVIELEQHITELTFDGNTAPIGSPGWHPRHVLKVHRHLPTGMWYLTWIGSVYNHATSDWDDDWAFRHSDKDPYLTSGDAAVALAQHLVSQTPFDN